MFRLQNTWLLGGGEVRSNIFCSFLSGKSHNAPAPNPSGPTRARSSGIRWQAGPVVRGAAPWWTRDWSRGGAGGGRRPVRSAGKVSHGSSQPGRYPTDLPGPGAVRVPSRVGLAGRRKVDHQRKVKLIVNERWCLWMCLWIYVCMQVCINVVWVLISCLLFNKPMFN